MSSLSLDFLSPIYNKARELKQKPLRRHRPRWNFDPHCSEEFIGKRRNHPSMTKGRLMLRSTFFSVGLFITMWGITFLFVDKLMIKTKDVPPQQRAFRGLFAAVTPKGSQHKIIDPPEWAAFSLLSIGTITILYSVALPRRQE